MLDSQTEVDYLPFLGEFVLDGHNTIPRSGVLQLLLDQEDSLLFTLRATAAAIAIFRKHDFSEVLRDV